MSWLTILPSMNYMSWHNPTKHELYVLTNNPTKHELYVLTNNPTKYELYVLTNNPTKHELYVLTNNPTKHELYVLTNNPTWTHSVLGFHMSYLHNILVCWSEGSLVQRVDDLKSQWSECDEWKCNCRIWVHNRPQKIINIKIKINELLFIYYSLFKSCQSSLTVKTGLIWCIPSQTHKRLFGIV